MLLHLGKDIVIPLSEVIAIIDKNSAFESNDTKDFFKEAENRGEIENNTKDIKTYVIADKFRGRRDKTKKIVIYTSNISSTTLKKRAGFVDNIINL